VSKYYDDVKHAAGFATILSEEKGVCTKKEKVPTRF
jgi:hypothetical protein